MGDIEKGILREAMAGILPADVRTRRKSDILRRRIPPISRRGHDISHHRLQWFPLALGFARGILLGLAAALAFGWLFGIIRPA